MSGIRLRNSTVADLDAFHAMEQDVEAARLVNVRQRDREVFRAHWTDNVLGTPGTIAKTVLVDSAIAGRVVRWIDEGDPGWDDEHVHTIEFWFGREYQGRGIATAAVRAFLVGIEHRPLFAGVATANAGAVRVLEKCGFTVDNTAAVVDFHGGGTVEYAEYKLD